jgi:hypothetical protein
VNILYCLEEWRGKQRISPPEDNFTPRDKIHPWGTTSPLGAKFSPWGEVKNGPLDFNVNLRLLIYLEVD